MPRFGGDLDRRTQCSRSSVRTQAPPAKSENFGGTEPNLNRTSRTLVGRYGVPGWTIDRGLNRRIAFPGKESFEVSPATVSVVSRVYPSARFSDLCPAHPNTIYATQITSYRGSSQGVSWILSNCFNGIHPNGRHPMLTIFSFWSESARRPHLNSPSSSSPQFAQTRYMFQGMILARIRCQGQRVEVFLLDSGWELCVHLAFCIGIAKEFQTGNRPGNQDSCPDVPSTTSPFPLGGGALAVIGLK